MVYQVVRCSHCEGEDVRRDGRTPAGKQRYKCKSYSRVSRENAQHERYSAAHKEQILRAYLERPSMRGIQRVFGVSRPTLIKWLKKDGETWQGSSPLARVQETLVPAEEEEVLELDELWSYVGSKNNPVWLWVALCRRTRQVVAQVVAWHHGPRSLACCGQLWHKIPASYKKGLIFTDFWSAYREVVPDNQHRACAKQEGQTNHVERFNLTLRQRVGRLTRKTLSFSKSHLMHLIHIRLFFLHYNQYCIHRFNLANSN